MHFILVSDKLTCLQTASELRYTDSNIFKTRWQPLRAAVQQKLTRDAEKLSKRKWNDDELSTTWVSSFQAATWDLKDGSPPVKRSSSSVQPSPPFSGGGGRNGDIGRPPSIGFEQPAPKKETKGEKSRRKSSYFT
jgi:hypothetical protein